jgi:hypothetical protein
VVGLVVGVSSRFLIAESPFQWGVLLTNKADIVLRFVLLKSKSPSFLSFSSMVVHAQLSTSFYFAGNELSKQTIILLAILGFFFILNNSKVKKKSCKLAHLKEKIGN